MTKREKKRQHFIPKSYLEAWTDPDVPKGQEPYVWAFPKEGGEGKAKAPVNIFKESDVYTIIGEDGSRDLKLENELSRLEREFKMLRQNILDRRGDITAHGRRILLEFNAAMHARSKLMRDHWREQYQGAHDWADGILNSIAAMSPEMRASFMKDMSKLHQPSEDEPTMSAGEFIESSRQAAKSPMPVVLGPEISSIFAKSLYYDVAIFESTTEATFITSDAPSIERVEYNSLLSLYVLPLSPRHALNLNVAGVAGYVEVPAKFVHQTNDLIRSHAHEYVVSSESILEM